MTTEAMIKELTSIQKDLQEMKRGITIASSRYNHLNFRVNQLKRKLSAELRKAQAQASQSTATPKDDPNQQLINFNNDKQ